jgi:hypothetical protein
MCFYRSTKNLKSDVHIDYINNCNTNLSLLTDMEHDYMHRLKLAIIRSIPNILNIIFSSTHSTSYIFCDSKYRVYFFAQIL